MFPNEASYAYDWTQNSKFSYEDFLRAKQFEKSIRFAIDDQTRKIVASNEDLAEWGYKLVANSLDQGFSTVSRELEDINSNIQRLSETLDWGFSEVLVFLGRMNDSLDTLITIARAPSQTWAYEQFEIARDEFKRGLYPKSLESLSRAISGHGSNLGHKTEFRFHFLLGTIRLGSYANSSSEIVDPQSAEADFLLAARYAKADMPAEAGAALICAGRAADVQGAIDRAIKYSRAGLELAPFHSEGYYQLARLLVNKGLFDEAAEALIRSIYLDINRAIIMTNEPVFLAKREFTNDVLNRVRKKYAAHYERTLDILTRSLTDISKYIYANVRAETLLRSELDEIQKAWRDADNRSKSDTIISYYAAFQLLNNQIRILRTLFSQYQQRLINLHVTRAAAVNSGHMPTMPRPTVFGMLPLLALVSCIYQDYGRFRSDHILWENTGAEILSSLFIGLALCGGIYLVFYVPYLIKLTRWQENVDFAASARRILEQVRLLNCPPGWNPEILEF